MSGRGSGGSGRENIRRLQQVEAELIRLFVDICEKEHLRYYMLYGTMLGAVRHKGFIPWDDDVDFGMPRPDYERFLLCAKQYCDAQVIRLKTFPKEPDYLPYFARLTDRRVKVAFLDTKQHQINDAWIDIFPLDGMPDWKLSECFHRCRIVLCRKVYTISRFDICKLHSKDRKWYDKLAIDICRIIPIYKLVSKEAAYRLLDNTAKKYPYETSNKIINVIGGYKFKEEFEKEVFGDGSLYEFEGMQLRGPQDYETYLTRLYGDYMTPPPESERNRHGTEVLAQGGGNTPL